MRSELFSSTGNSAWSINGTDSTSGTTTGTITNIRAHLSALGANCEFDVGSKTSSSGFSSSGTSTVTAGSQGGSFVNSTQVLTTNTAQSALGLWNVNPSATNRNCVSASISNQRDGLNPNVACKLVVNNPSTTPLR